MRERALELLRRGYATPTEIANTVGTSRQNVHNWAAAAGIDWQAARAKYLTGLLRHTRVAGD